MIVFPCYCLKKIGNFEYNLVIFLLYYLRNIPQCIFRYIRKCDLMNHLKIHAYIPEADGIEEEEMQSMEEFSEPEKKKKKQVGRRRKKEIKEEYETYEGK